MRNKASIRTVLFTVSAFLLFTPCTAIPVLAAEASTVKIQINTAADRKLISPYIYGINDTAELAGVTVRSVKQGGSRMTTYNWENNYSNSGSDWFNTSDNSLVSSYASAQQKLPALAAEKLLTQAQTHDIPFRITTLPMCGYVAADGNGPILDSQTAPSTRWIPVFNRKGMPFSLTPDLTDNAVYIDEYVNAILTKFGRATEPTGMNAYALDNEPDLWTTTHSTIHPNPMTVSELLDKSAELAAIVKGLDERALIFGGQFSGMRAFISFNDASDWNTLKGSHTWFLDYYLAQMKAAGTVQGKRLLDVLDLHYYSEASAAEGGTVLENEDYTNIELNKVRMQSTRTFWDSEYTENSWIGQTCQPYLPLIPTVLASINKNYAGTKLAFSEYNFGGGAHISGGIAQVDALGIFAREGVYQASLKPNGGNISYQKAAINLFTNYDGNGSSFGNTSVRANTSNNDASSVYASIQNADESILKIILINKNYETKVNAEIQIQSDVNYKGGTAYGFNSKGSNILNLHNFKNISNNTFNYEIPPLTVVHLILTADGSVPGTTTSDYSYTAGSTEASLQKTTKSESASTTVETLEVSSKTTSQTKIQTTSVSSGTEALSSVTSPADNPSVAEHDVPKVVKGIVIAFLLILFGGIVYLFFSDYIKRMLH